MYEVRLSTQAYRTYSHLDSKTQKRINKIVDSMEKGYFHKNNIISLHGALAGNLRYRFGDWRIVFTIDYVNQVVFIKSISSRGDAYR
ncbi:MAG: type II toxin-antitoxin system RelE/ParE family toxin [Candidatus Omnitrophota bacterium]